MKEHTPLEKKVWEYILKFENDYGVIPSNVQIARDLNIKGTPQWVGQLVTKSLSKKGYEAENKRLLKKIKVIHN